MKTRQYVNRGLINYTHLHKIYEEPMRLNAQEIWSEICQRLGMNYVLVGANGSIDKILLGDDICLPHFLPILCVIRMENCYLFVYYAWLSPMELLSTYALYPHYNLMPYSQVFNFIVFQFVQIYQAFMSRSIYPIFSPNVLYSDDNLWIFVGLHLTFQNKCFETTIRLEKIKPQEQANINSTRLWELTTAWCNRIISNYEYLIKLNEFAGHIRNDPHRHPIFPWVSDFKSETSLRPLDRTKYRLAKGDDQLNEQYSKQHPAHHIPEFLSDICYMVYKARNESKDQLCSVVRSQWVPEEYPSSMARLYEWTPDECIPEFFEDSNIFVSVHSDMPDLQLPVWTKTGKEFIEWHRRILESDEVSEKLNDWIDLVFGYLLTGEHAVKALNVQLSIVQKPTTRLRTHGAVQLFTFPHPKRKLEKPSRVSIFSHPDYNPAYYNLSSIKTLDTVGNHETFNLTGLLKKLYDEHNSIEEYVENSMMSIGITIVELVLAELCKELSSQASFADRLKQAQNLLTTKLYRIPGNLQHPLKILLKVESYENTAIKSHYLTSSVFNFFSLPIFIGQIHDKLAKFHERSQDFQIQGNLRETDSSFIEEQSELLAQLVEHEEMNSLWIYLFIDLLKNSKFASNFCHRLFWKISEFSNDNQLKRVIPIIAKLFEGVLPGSAKIFDRRFLLQLSIRFGSETFFDKFFPPIIEAILSHSEIISNVAKDSILWLARRYGPIVTATQITTSLLRLLALCYSQPSQLQPDYEEMSLDVTVTGDIICEYILDCLVEIAVIYGPAFITMQYIPYCADLIDQAIRRLTSPLESAIISAMLLLKVSCDCLSDKQLMDHLQELVIDQVLFPSIRLLSSTNFTFSSDKHRRLFTCKAIRSLHLISCRIGAENVQRHMFSVIQRLFCTFNLVYDLEENSHGGEPRVLVAVNAPKQLISTFTPGFARLLIQIFSNVCGRQYITGSLPNATLITKLATGSSSTSSTSLPISIIGSPSNFLAGFHDNHSMPFLSSSPILSSSPMLSSSISGNRLTLFTLGEESPDLHQGLGVLASSFDPTSNLTLNQKMRDIGPTHLTGAWIDRFRSALSSTSQRISFDQIQLCTFTGHTSTVRKLVPLGNENSFVSASSDKTIKLWSIKTVEESSSCQWTYKAHVKPIQDVCLLKFGRLIASTDSLVHIWDPFRGSAIHQLEWPIGGSDSAIMCLTSINHNTLVTASNAENIMRLFDIRAGQWVHHICAWTWTSGSSIRAVAVSPDATKFAVALTNGSTSVIDTRTGRILAYSVLHHSDAVQIEWLTNELFACTHTDHPAVLWSMNPRLKIVRRLNEIASSINFCSSDEQYVTVQSSSNRLKLYEKDECHSEIKLKSDFIAGSVSAMAYLRLNRMFLVGSNQGMIRLSC